MKTLFVLKGGKALSRQAILFGFIMSMLAITTNIYAQQEKDYRSIQSGLWNVADNWEYFNGTDWEPATYYPGEILADSCRQVTIETGHVISLTSNMLDTGKICYLLINGQLLLQGATNSAVLVGINVHEIRVYGTINFQNKVIFNLTDRTVVKFFGAGSLVGDCSNNQEIQIGGIKIAACNGAPGNVYTFDELMDAGGTLDANIDSPTPYSTYYCGYNVPLQGHFAGVYGTTTANGSTNGVNYSWYIDGSAISGATGILTLKGSLSTVYNFKPSNPLTVGEHKIAFKVTTYNEDLLYENTVEHTIIVPDSAKWTGASNNAWETYTNWFNDCIPDEDRNVEIAGGLTNYPTISSAADCKNLTIRSGATLLDNSLLTVHGTSNVEQYLLESRSWYMSSPVSNVALPETGYTLWSYPESDANQNINGTTPFTWTRGNYWNRPTGNFEVGKGYIVVPQAAETFIFTGTLNSGDVILSGLTKSYVNNPV